MSDGNWQRWAAVSREIIKPLIKLDWRNIATDFWHSSSVGTIKEGISKHGLENSVLRRWEGSWR